MVRANPYPNPNPNPNPNPKPDPNPNPNQAAGALQAAGKVASPVPDTEA